ncbi:MAG TPA: class I SAM-dependent methyltransferase [Mycobacteriales bacterium]|nr:class I SAM-dependent methyltransferase [Mycobacteriales bacterium]
MLTRGVLSHGRDPVYLRYAIWGQRRVDGWLRDLGVIMIDQAEGMQRDLDITGGVAEIGVHHGRLLILLSLLRRSGESAVAIDLFEDQHLNVDSSGRGNRAWLQRNLNRWDPRHSDVKIVKANSWELDGDKLREFAGGPLRLVSVDGGHTVDLTQHDLKTACDSLGPGGIVILDDCFNEYFPSVAEGAQIFFREHREYVPFATGGNKTLICHEDCADEYRSMIRARITGGPLNVESRIFLDRPIVVAEPLTPRRARRYWRGYAKGRVRAALWL